MDEAGAYDEANEEPTENDSEEIEDPGVLINILI